MAAKKKEAREGFTLVKAEGEAIAWGGESYPVVDGVAEVPSEAVPDFAPHGVFPISE